MRKESIIIIGAGPCGLAAGIALRNKGYDPLLIEKNNVVHSIYEYPSHQTFFSSSEKLEIGGFPFPSNERKPKRHEALVYYRQVAQRSNLRIQSYEEVEDVIQDDTYFHVKTKKQNGPCRDYAAKKIIVATGYYDNPNLIGIPGESLPHVFHYFKENHPFFQKKVTVIGGKNSAVDATLALEQAGAEVTVLYRGSEFTKEVKPWILPDFHSLVRHGVVTMEYDAQVTEITSSHVHYEKNGKQDKVETDFVLAMTGYHPDHSFLQEMGVGVEKDTGRPVHNKETMESNVKGIFIAGVIAAGNDANEIFIENGRHHGKRITDAIEEEGLLG
ncbi:YpdA family putative bacillithiol disulfide reductase [Salibacterium salarium]|uniref:YpdA family putative bacillithiol disulfide reductase n=1 Tax=Salibacterium salarium TaxID=284579 RepID=A0A3R9QRY1_9BACI|nr:YpdA family putative bacillithiol disulfide reductase [Salibacterium salarium]RSL32080.1 YpdA family putative bacillithiol disulfide reductase [Salibacterium salarium]